MHFNSYEYCWYLFFIQFITQGTIDNNLVPDCLTGPRIYTLTIVENQPFNYTTLFGKSVFCMVIKCARSEAWHFFYSYYSCRTLDRTFIVCSYDGFGPRIELIALPTTSRCATCYAVVYPCYTIRHIDYSANTLHIPNFNVKWRDIVNANNHLHSPTHH